MITLRKENWRLIPIKAYAVFWLILDWLFPPTCINCGAEGHRICPQCQNSFGKSASFVCSICGRRIRSTGVCYQCKSKKPNFDQLRSLYDYNNSVREAIHRLKYKNDMGLADKLAEPLIDFYRAQGWKADLIVPLPLFDRRQIERGYNQSALLAIPISLKLGIKYRPSAIIRIKNTKSQVGLNEEERWENVSDAFVADPQIVDNKTILIIDDVTTTGATMNAAALAAKIAGAKTIYCLTFARALRGFDKTIQI